MFDILKFEHDSEAFWSYFYILFDFLCVPMPSRIARQWSREKFAILSPKPQGQPSPQALRFSHGRGEREMRVTGDEPQGTMGRVQTGGCPLPAFLCAPVFIEKETSGYEVASESS